LFAIGVVAVLHSLTSSQMSLQFEPLLYCEALYSRVGVWHVCQPCNMHNQA